MHNAAYEILPEKDRHSGESLEKWSNGKIIGDLHEDAEVVRFFDDDE